MDFSCSIQSPGKSTVFQQIYQMTLNGKSIQIFLICVSIFRTILWQNMIGLFTVSSFGYYEDISYGSEWSFCDVFYLTINYRFLEGVRECHELVWNDPKKYSGLFSFWKTWKPRCSWECLLVTDLSDYSGWCFMLKWSFDCTLVQGEAIRDNRTVGS